MLKRRRSDQVLGKVVGRMKKPDDQGPGRIRSPYYASRKGSEVFVACEMGGLRELRAVPVRPLANNEGSNATAVNRLIYSPPGSRRTEKFPGSSPQIGGDPRFL